MKKVLKLTMLASSLLLAGVSASSYAATQDAASAMPDISGKKVLVGFWHNWASKSDGYQRGTSAELPLSAVPEAYNVVTVAFMTGDGIPTFKPYNMSDEQFRSEVATLNAQNRAVILSLGGADAHIELKQGDAQKFADEIIRLVEKYGFDGLDIDLEGGAISAGANITEIPAALKMVKQQYPHFIISMAPEFPYLQAGRTGYVQLIKSLEGYYDFISPQFYNQGGDGVSVEGIGWLAQNNQQKKGDFLFYLTDSIIHGTRGYIQIPADKFAIGLPSNPDAAATGYVNNEADVGTTLQRLAAQGTPIKGLMTWSVNWDAGRDASGNPYGYEFVNRYAGLINEEHVDAPDTEAPGAPGKPAAVVTASMISLQWRASVDNLGVHHYEIWRDGVQVAQPTLPEWHDTRITPATQYAYQVIAVDKAGNRSVPSEIAYVTSDDEVQQPEQDVQAPSVPQDLQASAITQTSVQLKWQAATDNVAVTGYQVWRNGILVAPMSNTQWTDSGLQADSTYLYQISAVDAAGNQSVKSQTVTVKTLAQPENDNPGNGGDHSQWSSQKIYHGGDMVSWQGKTYKAKWWTQNNQPDTNDVWENLDKEIGGAWNSSEVYLGGDEVSYQGKTWQAKWWTKGDKPGTNDVWRLK
ncbi:glycosyl hydrolase family 18 protein [Enterobacter asburiae]|uniref:carbohydrate-binding protein n=1 Tax=Scandinavium sp. UTDF21-P1B TaxID=3446379 RepID=UPI00346C0C40